MIIGKDLRPDDSGSARWDFKLHAATVTYSYIRNCGLNWGLTNQTVTVLDPKKVHPGRYTSRAPQRGIEPTSPPT